MAAEEGAEAAGCRIHPPAGLAGSIWRQAPCGASAALEVEVADRRPLWGHCVAWTRLAEPRPCMCEGSWGPWEEDETPSSLWPHEGGKGWKAKACRGPTGTLAGPAARGRTAAASGAGPFLLSLGWHQPSPGGAHRDRVRERRAPRRRAPQAGPPAAEVPWAEVHARG